MFIIIVVYFIGVYVICIGNVIFGIIGYVIIFIRVEVFFGIY